MKRLTHPATLLATIALFVALGGGAAWASGLISGSKIKNHSIAEKKLSRKAITQLRGHRGPRGATGPEGPAGPAGPSGASQILFSSGGGNLSNNAFVGVGSVSATETSVQQVVSAPASFTSMRCFVQTAPTANITFTLRKNGATTALSCTINSGQTSGSGSSAAVSVAAGDLVDVATPGGSTPGKPGTFAVSG